MSNFIEKIKSETKKLTEKKEFNAKEMYSLTQYGKLFDPQKITKDYIDSLNDLLNQAREKDPSGKPSRKTRIIYECPVCEDYSQVLPGVKKYFEDKGFNILIISQETIIDFEGTPIIQITWRKPVEIKKTPDD